MERRDVQTVIAVLLAGVIGFAVAVLVMDDDDDETPVVQTGATATVATTPTDTDPETVITSQTSTSDRVPQNEQPTRANCIDLWNEGTNRGPQGILADLQNRQAVRINIGADARVPPRCLVTIIANDGTVLRFTEGGGQSFPYAPQPTRMRVADLDAGERETHALSESSGILTPR